jgi:glycosyltransferase involved in cell wall biosynthesis
MKTVSIMVPIFNEERHLERLLPILKKINIPIFILDSGSDDKSIAIIKKYKLKVISGNWKRFSDKLNYGLDLNPYQTDWIIRIDADEYLDSNFIDFLKSNKLKDVNNNVDAIYINRKIIFLGKWMKHGGVYPGKIVRIIRPGKAYYEPKELDEHVITKNPLYINIDVVDHPLYDLSQFLSKHIGYAKRFRDDYFSNDHRDFLFAKKGQNYLKISLQNFFLKSPLFLRCFIYWIYRYFIRLGFMDGARGFIFTILHAFIYRFIIDALIYEEKLKLKKNK